MTKLDRLSALMSRFELTVELCERETANFLVLGEQDTGEPTFLCLLTEGHNAAPIVAEGKELLSARVSWGGTQNPILAALPRGITHGLDDDWSLRAIVDLLLSEQQSTRCGSASVLSRLAEVLIVRLMRKQIESQHLGVGLLAGLADPRLSRAIVAMHDKPGHPWRVSSLAEEAGLSSSHFSELFRRAVGVAPLAYLRQWRMILARQDIERGDRLQRVATRYCYGSVEALSRACTQAYGASPRQLRKTAAPTGKHQVPTH